MRPCPWGVAELLPHQPPMLLLDEVLGVGETALKAALTIRPESLFVEPQGVPGHIGIEYMAQACGAWAGAQARRAGRPPRLGFLLGARRLRLHRPWFALGERLLVTVTLNYRDEAMAAFEGRIDIGGEPAAESDLTVYEPPEQGDRLA